MRHNRRYSLVASTLLSSALLLACGSSPGNDARNTSVTNPPLAEHPIDPEVARSVAAWKAAGASDEHQSAAGSGYDYRVPSNYLKYPEEVRSIIRRTDMENDHCRGSGGDDPETLRACNRRYYLLLALEKRGWCWGGGDYGYQEHWLRCRDDPDYRLGQYGAQPPYSETDIQEVIRLRKGK